MRQDVDRSQDRNGAGLGAAGFLHDGDEAVRKLLDSIKDYAIFLLTPDGHVASWNKGAQQIKGYRAEEIIGQHFSVFYPPEALANGWPAKELAWAQQGGRFEDEGWRVRQDGSLFWANVVISAVLASDGSLLGFSKVTRDLTERREHEARLEASERNVRLLIDSVQDYAIFQLAPDGTISSWNAGAQRIKQYTAEEAIGHHFSMFYPAEAIRAGWPDEELKRAAAQGRLEDEGWRLRRDGSLFWANVVITAIRDEGGALLGFSKVTRDLTERRQQEEALREREHSLRLLVEGSKDHAMFLLSLDGRVCSWNSGAARLLGYGEADALGLEYASFFALEDGTADRPDATLSTALALGFAQAQGWRTRADGTRIWCECSLTLRRNAAGEPSGFVALFRDLTERRNVERLQAEGARMTQFIATLSHELRNPLAPIRHALEALGRKTSEPAVKWASAVIDRQVSLLTRLVDDLLDFSRAASGRIQLQRAPLDFTGLVEAAAGSSAGLMKSHQHKLRLDIPAQPIAVMGDYIRLTQALTNVLNNAAKYTPPGGVVTISLARAGGDAVVTITDTGTGMPENMLQLAFEPFVQADRTLERSEGGMGIGLALVKRLVELHGGTVSLASPGLGLGTTVRLVIPADDAVQLACTAPQQGAGGHAASIAAGQRILVVDDNVDAADSLAGLLKEEGQEVAVAYDGPQALDVAPIFKPDVVLMDVGLPGMNGLQVAARMRALPGFSAVQFIAVTGYGQPSDVAASKAAGFDAHLTKPFGFEQLIVLLAGRPT